MVVQLSAETDREAVLSRLNSSPQAEDQDSARDAPFVKAESPLLDEEALIAPVEEAARSRPQVEVTQDDGENNNVRGAAAVSEKEPHVPALGTLQEDIPAPTSSGDATIAIHPDNANNVEEVATAEPNDYAEVGIQTEPLVIVEHRAAQWGMDIRGSLQQVLARLKTAKLGKPELREVDDLLFEIRTEAQNAVGRTRIE